MKNATLTTVLFATLLALAGSAAAGTINLVPTPADLYDLDHYKAYTWGMDLKGELTDKTVTSATLSFDSIRNWNDDPNVLYIRMLDTAAEGVTSYYDGSGWTDYFDGQGIEIETYYNLPDWSQDLEYVLTEPELDTLNQYLLNDGDMALALDPDCHFYNSGVSLEMTYADTPGPNADVDVPEPITMVTLAVGIGGLVWYRRKSLRLPKRQPSA